MLSKYSIYIKLKNKKRNINFKKSQYSIPINNFQFSESFDFKFFNVFPHILDQIIIIIIIYTNINKQR